MHNGTRWLLNWSPINLWSSSVRNKDLEKRKYIYTVTVTKTTWYILYTTTPRNAYLWLVVHSTFSSPIYRRTSAAPPVRNPYRNAGDPSTVPWNSTCTCSCDTSDGPRLCRDGPARPWRTSVCPACHVNAKPDVNKESENIRRHDSRYVPREAIIQDGYIQAAR